MKMLLGLGLVMLMASSAEACGRRARFCCSEVRQRVARCCVAEVAIEAPSCCSASLDGSADWQARQQPQQGWQSANQQTKPLAPVANEQSIMPQPTPAAE